jgi:hypothetical protein
MKRFKSVAYHEAGHAVAGAVLLKRFAPVSVDGRGGKFHGGLIEVHDSDQYARWNAAVLCMAGPYAEARAGKMSRWLAVWRGGNDDKRDASELIAWLVARGFAKSERDAWEYIEAATPAFLTKNWGAIERVAAELLKRGRLEADEVRQLAI